MAVQVKQESKLSVNVTHRVTSVLSAKKGGCGGKGECQGGFRALSEMSNKGGMSPSIIYMPCKVRVTNCFLERLTRHVWVGAFHLLVWHLSRQAVQKEACHSHYQLDDFCFS
ncbi:hypothetical protein ILYODFUR_009490 [Ilyodon furcidens]|uniref:Uncharacterized protein n=1 Tax=Ilyodon furcidens TaxID=33524 RepID=A0ABV0T7P9_9TELE